MSSKPPTGLLIWVQKAAIVAARSLLPAPRNRWPPTRNHTLAGFYRDFYEQHNYGNRRRRLYWLTLSAGVAGSRLPAAGTGQPEQLQPQRPATGRANQRPQNR